MYLDLTPSSNLFYGLIGKGYKRLLINATPDTAMITFSGSGIVQTGSNYVWVTSGSTISYSVSATGYTAVTGSVTVTDNQTIDVALEILMVTLTISPTPNTATVVLTADGYTQSGNAITVPYGTTVAYTVSATGYTTVTDSVVVTSTQTVEIELEPA